MAVSNIIARGIGFSPGSVKYVVTAGFLAGASVAVEEITYTGGWPSYGYRKRRKHKKIDEIEEKIESQEIEIDDTENKLRQERLKADRLEAKARRKKSEEQALIRLKAEIVADMQSIEEMRRIHDELLTLRYLEEYQDTKRRKRNQMIAVMMEA